jgi:DtxR family Mn-dependent transcriptional regulator
LVVPDKSKAVEDYLKAIYRLCLERNKVTPSHVADDLRVSSAAVTKMVQKLKDLKLVHSHRERGLTLTPAGEKIALEVIRHHRLLELYLTEALGYSWDEVHQEAEKLEHVISEHFEERIEKLLGYPTHDPHGSPIPTRDGRVEAQNLRALTALQPGDKAVIRQVSDRDAEMLSFLGGLGMYPGAAIEMMEREPYGGSLRIKVAGKDQAIGSELAEHVFVSAGSGSSPGSNERVSHTRRTKG